MNYRHFYHVGSFADVFKHSLLTAVIDALCQKDKPFCYIDTHAGIGNYDLTREETQRSKEYREGIQKLLHAKDPPPDLSHYIELINAYQQHGDLHCYPGSPVLAKRLLRPGDQLIVNEFHPADYQTLKYSLGKSPNIHCHHRDAYEFLPAVLPPSPARACILIDPPYERSDEFPAIMSCLHHALQRFPSGVYMIWYPIVSLQHRTFTRQILREKLAPTLITEMTLTAIPEEKSGMIGCGMVILNPPWKIEKSIASHTQYLAALFKRDESGYYRTEFIE
jgi:23S rRNA (adenine2030-N6)-methyltransferase